MREEWETLIEDCENREENLTDWERGFIDNIKRQVLAGHGLSQKQETRLNEIWDRVTSKG